MYHEASINKGSFIHSPVEGRLGSHLGLEPWRYQEASLRTFL